MLTRTRRGGFAVLLALSTILVLAVVSAAPLDPSGDLDVANFNANGFPDSIKGKNQTNWGLVPQFGEARGAALQSNGSIVVGANAAEGASTFHFAAVRLNPNGTQDFSFGDGGDLRVVISANDFLNDVAVYPTNDIHKDKIVLVGFTSGNPNLFAVVRLTKDGQPDTSFSGDGIATVDFNGVTSNLNRANAVAIQDDGKIVVAGYRRDNAAGARGSDVALARFNLDGSLDTTFDGDGKVINPVGTGTGDDRANDVEIIGTGSGRKILIGGRTRNQGSTTSQYLLVQYNNNGSIDTGFNGDGIATSDIPGNADGPNGFVNGGEEIRGIDVQADGKIVATGGWNSYATFPSTSGATGTQMLTMRFLANGNLDTAGFNANGNDAGQSPPVFRGGPGYQITHVARFYHLDIGMSIQVGTDGKITAFGQTTQTSDITALADIPPGGHYDDDFLFVRFLSNGEYDTSFRFGKRQDGVNQNIDVEPGISIIECSDGFTFDGGDALVLDSINRPIGIGARTFHSQADPSVNETYITAAKVSSDGTPDHTFGFDVNPQNGIPDAFWFTQLLRGSADFGNAIARASNGTYVVAGSTDNGSNNDVAWVRYNANGTFNQRASGNNPANGGRSDSARAVVIQSDGKVVTAGESTGGTGNPVESVTLMRFNGTSLDGTFDGDGVATLSVGTNSNSAKAVAIDANGKFVIAGTTSDSAGDWNGLVARFNANGTLDTTFASPKGYAILNMGGGQNFDQFNSVAIQPDGKIVVGGYSNSQGQGSYFAIARYNADGTIDTSFDSDGFVKQKLTSDTLTFAGDEIRAIALTHDGKIVAAGKALIPTFYDGSTQGFNGLAIARFNSNGSLDTTFGTNGFTVTALGNPEMDEVYSLALQHDEKAIVVGNALSLDAGDIDTVIARYNWTGTFDSATYANGGFTKVNFEGFDIATGVLVIPQGAAGAGKAVMSVSPGSADIAIGQFLGDPAPNAPGMLDLVAASDSGRFNTDNITNDDTPTFHGTCTNGETVILTVDGSVTQPLSRDLCEAGQYDVTAAVDIADGVHQFRVFSRNGAGDTAAIGPLQVTIDTVALPVTVVAPAEGSDVLPDPTISGTGAEFDADVNVTHNVGGAAVCTDRADNAGAWSCASVLPPASYTLAVRQVDIAGNTSTPTLRSFNVKAATTTVLAGPAADTVWGEPATFTATVTSVGDYGTPNGTVRFDVDGGSGGGGTSLNGTLNASGVATVSPTDLEVGPHIVEAFYLGAQLYFPSDSDTVDHTVNKADTTVALQSDANPSVFGQQVTLTATVAVVAPGAGNRTGTVQFYDGGTLMGAPVALASNQAQIQVSTFSVGTHDITAAYSGDSHFNASTTASALDQEVVKASTSVTFDSDDPDPSDVNEVVTFVFSVDPVAPGAGTPTGDVIVSDGDIFCQATVAVGECTLTFTTVGPKTLTATYEGDGNFEGDTSPDETHTINKVATTTTITGATPNPSMQGKPATFTFTVTSNIANAGTPTGDVTISDGGTNSCTATVAVGSCQITFPDAGPVNLTATYAGDDNFLGSSSTPPATQGVTPAPRALITTGAGGVAVAELTTTTDTYTVVLNAQPDDDVTVELSVGDGQSQVSTNAGPFGATASLTFDSDTWDDPQTVTVKAVDDAVDEASPHTGAIGHGVVSDATGYSDEAEIWIDGVQSATGDLDVSISDDDTAGVTLASGPLQVTEAAGANHTATFTVVLHSQPTGTVQFDVASSDTTEGTVSPATLTFTAADWDDPQEVTITGVDDSIRDGTVTFQAAVTTNAGGTADALYEAISPSSAPAETLDDDPAPTVQFGAATSLVLESVAAPTVDVSLSHATFETVTVNYSVTGGTAAGAGEDYTLASGMLTFSPFDTSETIALSFNNDSIDEDDETIEITLSTPVNATLGTPSAHTLTIDDDDDPVVQFTTSSSSSSETAGTASLTVDMVPSSTRTITVDYAIGGSSTAAGEGDDYTLAAGTLTFDPTEVAESIVVQLHDDVLDEDDETIVVTLSNPVNATIGTNGTFTLTILDDEAPPSVQFTATASNDDEGAGTMNLGVELSAVSGRDVTVDYAVTGGTATTADFTLASGTLTIEEGLTSDSIELQLINDLIDEDDQTLVVTLSNPVNATLGANTAHTFTINDDDDPPVADFASPTSSGDEDTTPATVEVVLANPSEKPVDVGYVVTGGSATGGGTDYTLASGTLTFLAGDDSENIAITLADDGLDEDDETIEITLATPTNATLPDPAPVHTFSITDDDPLPVVEFGTNPTDGDESVSAVSLEVTLSAVSGRDVAVPYTVTGTATSGPDHTLASGSLTIGAGNTSASLDFTVEDDLLDEDNETVVVTLGTTPTAALGAADEHTYTIADNDGEPQLSFEAATSSAAESEGDAGLVVSLDNPAGRTVTVDYAVTGGTATGGGTDYTLAAGTLTFDPLDTSETIQLEVVDDSLDEIDETVVVTLANPVNAELGTDERTHTIVDDDTTVRFQAASGGGPEIASPVFVEVVLEQASTKQVTVNYAVTGGTADNNFDYHLAAGTLTFQPGQVSKTIKVTVVNDPLFEPAETIVLALSGATNAALGTPSTFTYTLDAAIPTLDRRTCLGKLETLVTTKGSIIYGTPGNDVIVGSDASETIQGLGGNDTICARGGTDTVYGGDGNDRILTGPGDDRIFGGAGNDRIWGGLDDDQISGGPGNDVILSRGGDDTVLGGGGNDNIKGGDGDDRILGHAGDDRLYGNGGNDELRGGGGKDLLRGARGADQILGQAGEDNLGGGPGPDTCNGGPGTDTIPPGGGCETVVGVP